MEKAVWIALLLVTAIVISGTKAAETRQPGAADQATIVNGNNQFALDLYGRLRIRDGNVFFSGFSISSALAMVSVGARGATAEELARTLRVPIGDARVHGLFAGVQRDVSSSAKQGSELLIANALWTQSGLPILPDFQSTATKTYGAGLTPVDFRRAPEKARSAINAWAERETRDRIKDLVPEGLITPLTRVVLTNAIYFKGVWKQPFPPAATRPDSFRLPRGERLDGVPFMTQSGRFRYLASDGLQVLDLPYGSGEQSMIVVLPTRVDGLAELETRLTAGRVAELVATMTEDEVIVVLPRFKFTAEFLLKQALSGLGMTRSFAARQADFSGITAAEPLVLSEVIHKAYVEVNEKGTEAAAATAAAVMTTSIRRQPAVFRADHPFFFVIRDNTTGSLLFAGRFVVPRGK